MKKIVRVFIYLSIAVSIILFVFCVIGITSAAIGIMDNPSVYSIQTGFLIFLIFLSILIPVVPIIVGNITLNKLKNAKTKDEMVLPAIFCLIFCSLVSGIVLLVMSDEDYNDGAKIVKGEDKEKVSDLEKRISKLKEMKEKKLISEEEYESLRKKAIFEELD